MYEVVGTRQQLQPEVSCFLNSVTCTTTFLAALSPTYFYFFRLLKHDVVGMAKVLEIRVSTPINPDLIRENRPCWPAMEHDSSYDKFIVGPAVQVTTLGIEGNAAGYPTHISDTINRAVLLFNEPTYATLSEKFPDATKSLVRGGFGENLVVNHPNFAPSEVCVGDKYKIGNVICMVTGPRAPCPKVDGWHGVRGMTNYCREHGLAGYFLKVLQEGTFTVGDEVILIERIHPGYSIERISQGIWGPGDLKDDSVEFLTALANMEELIGRHYRETAQARLERINARAD